MAIPSGYTPLDLVGFTDKGTYANNVPYVKNDLVHYGGDIWKCKVDNTTGVIPVDGVNWEIFIGEPTNLVERIIAPLETNPATIAYTIGRQIIYDDWLWEVIAPIAIGDTLVDYAVDPSNANIKKAPAVETQLLAIKNGLGTAAEKNSTTEVTSGSNDLITSGGVYTETNTIKQALTTVESKIPYFPNGGWTTLSNGVNYKKSGSLVFIKGTHGVDVTVTGGSLAIGTLPSGARPYVKICIPCLASHENAYLIIDTDGSVVLNTNKTTSFYLYLCASFPVNL